MIVMNSVGMVLFFKTFDMVYMREDSLFAERMRLSMGIADKSPRLPEKRFRKAGKYGSRHRYHFR